MSWVKLDDRFPDHPKAAGLSDAAFRAYITSLCYAARFLTDGFIPLAIARKLALPKVLIQLTVGLWDEAEDGYQIHDYLDYNPSRNSVLNKKEEIRQARSNAGSKGAAKRWQTDGNPMPSTVDSKPMAPFPSPSGSRSRTRPPEEKNARAPEFRPGLESSEPPETGFVREYVRQYEQARARPPPPTHLADAARLEKDFGTANCIEAAAELNWQKHPNYLRTRLEDRINDNRRLQAPGRSVARSARRAAPNFGPAELAAWDREAASDH